MSRMNYAPNRVPRTVQPAGTEPEPPRSGGDREKKLPREWEVIDRVRVIDPDGWSHGSYRSWGEPINREEWERRLATSTVDLFYFDH